MLSPLPNQDGEMTVCLLTLDAPKYNTRGFDNLRSVSACVPEAFCTVNFNFF